MQINHLTLIRHIIMIDIRHSDISYSILIHIDDCYALAINLQFLYSYGITIGEIDITIADNADIVIISIRGCLWFLVSDNGCNCHIFRGHTFSNLDILSNLTILYHLHVLCHVVGLGFRCLGHFLYLLGHQILFLCALGLPFFRRTCAVNVSTPAEQSVSTKFCTCTVKGMFKTHTVIHHSLLDLITRLCYQLFFCRRSYFLCA